jgi:hypothetical protein
LPVVLLVVAGCGPSSRPPAPSPSASGIALAGTPYVLCRDLDGVVDDHGQRPAWIPKHTVVTVLRATSSPFGGEVVVEGEVHVVGDPERGPLEGGELEVSEHALTNAVCH